MNPAGRQRIGILGGTFNPIHLGHLILAETAMETYEMSRVLLIPCNRPPHKDSAQLIDAAHRLAMVQLAVEDSLHLEPCDIEVKRGGVSYAVDTLAELGQAHPDADLYFIVGTDALRELHLWRNVYSLLPLCTFVAFARPGHPADAIAAADLRLAPPWPERLLQHVTQGRLIEISSSDIRHRVAEGMRIRYLVPPCVEMYIAEHGLYGGRSGVGESGAG